MEYFIDSSAWIEYLDGSSKGEKVNEILQSENEIFVLPITIAEVVSKIKRKNSNSELAYKVIMSNSKIMEFTPKIAKEAGLLHVDMKLKNSSFSLADALIIISAKSISAKVITKDNHFKGFKEAVII